MERTVVSMAMLWAMRKLIPLSVACVVSVAIVTVAQAQGSSVKDVFEKYGLLGIFAWDCSKPASDSNWYYINREIDRDHVQRDFMTGPTKRNWFLMVDKASALGPAEAFVSGTRDGRRVSGVWRVEGARMQQWDADDDGKKIIERGKLLSTGRDLPWLNKCGAGGQ